MKLKVQAQHLQPGDVVGSGEKVTGIVLNSICWPSSKCLVEFQKGEKLRQSYWGKYTMINVERANKSIKEMELEEERKYKD